MCGHVQNSSPDYILNKKFYRCLSSDHQCQMKKLHLFSAENIERPVIRPATSGREDRAGLTHRTIQNAIARDSRRFGSFSVGVYHRQS